LLKRIVSKKEFVAINLEVDRKRRASLLQEEEGEHKSAKLKLGILA
jgi:hypothetical protein